MKKIKLEFVVNDDKFNSLLCINDIVNKLYYDTESFNIVVEECDG